MVAPGRNVTRAVEEWNASRVVATRERVEHFLNGVKTAEYPVDVPFANTRFRNLRIRKR